MPAYTSPDNLQYPVGADSFTFRTILTSLATSVQTALTNMKKGTNLSASSAAARDTLATSLGGAIEPMRIWRADLDSYEVYAGGAWKLVPGNVVGRTQKSTVAQSIANITLTTINGMTPQITRNMGVGTGSLTISHNGIYQVNAQIGYQGSTGGTLRLARILLNNTTPVTTDSIALGAQNPGTSSTYVYCSVTVGLAAGDTLKLVAYQDSGGALGVQVAADSIMGTYLEATMVALG